MTSGEVKPEMKNTLLKFSSTVLVIILLTNIFIFGLAGSVEVEAGFSLSDYKGGIVTALKGLLMLWIMNLISHNIGADDNEGLITSTIKNGLNMGAAEQSDDLAQESKVNITPNEINRDNITEKEEELLELVNTERRKQGIQPLKIEMDLVSVARLKAQDMISNDYFEHYSPTYGSPFEMMKARGIKYSLAGENLAAASTVKKGFRELTFFQGMSLVPLS